MSFLKSVLDAILKGPTAPAATSTATTPAATTTSAATPAQPTDLSPSRPSDSAEKVDVAAVLDRMANTSDEKLDWRHSIVDLLKVIHHDSSHNARVKLAQELNYKGDVNNSSAMNMWLHAQVMNQLREHGGQLPDDLK